MRVYLDQIGCRLNYSEMDTLASQLRAAGHAVVDDPGEADVVVFNTCAVTAEAGRKSRRRVRQLGKQHAQARIALTGCWATLQPRQAAALPGVELVVQNAEKDLLQTLLDPWSADFEDPAALARVQPNGNPFSGLDERTGRTRAFIKVQDGCNNRCTFCIVTVARGESRSRTVASIVDEVQSLAADGVQEAVLTGVHLGSYGRDPAEGAQSDLKELTRAILTDTDMPRVRLSSLEPWELADGFFDLWDEWPKRLCPHLHLPLQAGTDRQLRHMARRCTTDSFRSLVCDARAAIDDLIITTDIIVGFPGETAGDFAAGLEFVEEMRFAHAHIFPFSARTGTAAARFGNQIPRRVKQRRSQQMHALVAATGDAERRRYLGKVRPVLWETAGDPLDDGGGRLWSGYTDNYLRVSTVVPETVDLHNQLTDVHLTELNGETFFGTLVQVNDF